MSQFLSPESVRVASAVAAQREHAQELLGGGRTPLAASGCPAPALEAPDGQAQFVLRY